MSGKREALAGESRGMRWEGQGVACRGQEVFGLERMAGGNDKRVK